MSIVLFKEITTEEVLLELEADGKKYDGLYVDMEDKKQRKYVKDSAALVNGLLKKVERARIDKSKEYKFNVEAEAKAITVRLEAANAPFTLLIEAHNDNRKQILAEEKRVEEVKEAYRLAVIAQELRDEHHEMAILLMAEDFRQREAVAEQARIDQIAHDEYIALQATAEAERKAAEAITQAGVAAKQAELDKIKAEERAEQAVIEAKEVAKAVAQQAEFDKELAIKAEQKRVADDNARLEQDAADREANTKHKGKVNSAIMHDLMVSAGLSESDAKNTVRALAKKLIQFTEIRY